MLEEDEDTISLELAVFVDAGTLFCKATYTLEGGGVLITDAYDQIEVLR
jgi:hypothetical protein